MAADNSEREMRIDAIFSASFMIMIVLEEQLA